MKRPEEQIQRAVVSHLKARSMPGEEWRPIVGWTGTYEVSSEGRVRRAAPGVHTFVGKIIKPQWQGKYRQVTLCDGPRIRNVRIHFAVVAAFIGSVPNGHAIDHINGDKDDNRLVNLRIVLAGDNAKNRAINKNSSTGAKGVSFHKRSRKYVARIQVNGNRIHIGEFDCIDAAASAYKRAAIKYFGYLAREYPNEAA